MLSTVATTERNIIRIIITTCSPFLHNVTLKEVISKYTLVPEHIKHLHLSICICLQLQFLKIS